VNKQLAKRVLGSVVGGLANVEGTTVEMLHQAMGELLASPEYWKAIKASVNAANAARAAKAKAASSE
jgi:hypothetical protein